MISYPVYSLWSVIFLDSVIAPNIKQKELNDFVTLLIWAVTCEY